MVVAISLDDNSRMMSTNTKALSKRIEAFRGVLRKAGLKVTPQREEIFRELACSVEHPDAELILTRVRRRLPTVSPDTVYRTIGLLEKAKLVWKVGTLRGRARFDANMDPHHHFICSECAGVQDFDSRSLDRLRAPREARSLGIVQSLRVQVRGVCSTCAARRRKRKTR